MNAKIALNLERRLQEEEHRCRRRMLYIQALGWARLGLDWSFRRVSGSKLVHKVGSDNIGALTITYIFFGGGFLIILIV